MKSCYMLELDSDFQQEFSLVQSFYGLRMMFLFLFALISHEFSG